MSIEAVIGKKIRTFRKERQLSQSNLVERLKEYGIKMSRETLSKIENNQRIISAVELRAISKTMNIDINEFFPEDEGEDMITFFRRGNFPEETLEEISKIQNMVKFFLEQERIYKEGQ